MESMPAMRAPVPVRQLGKVGHVPHCLFVAAVLQHQEENVGRRLCHSYGGNEQPKQHARNLAMPCYIADLILLSGTLHLLEAGTVFP
jgi:hypothetical protein